MLMWVSDNSACWKLGFRFWAFSKTRFPRRSLTGRYVNRLLGMRGASSVVNMIVIGLLSGPPQGSRGVRQLARMLIEELPEHRSFEYTYKAVEGRMGFLEWTYEDVNVRVKDGADSYLIEDGKIVAQTIHYTVEQK